MNPKNITAQSLHWMWLVVLCNLLSISRAAPVPLPEWVQPIAASLPKLSPEVISEIDDIFTKKRAIPEWQPEVRREYATTVAPRFMELQEQASLAMLWQFLKATEDSKRLMEVYWLLDDRDLAAWLLPLIRFRVEWLIQKVQAGTITNFEPYDGELIFIQEYFFTQGEYEDIQLTERLFGEIKKKGMATDAPRGWRSPQEQLASMQKAREKSLQENEPFWKMYAYLLDHNLVVDGSLKSGPSEPIQVDYSNRPKPLGPRKPLPVIPPPPTPFVPKPWMIWPMWAFIVLVSAGLLRWLFRRPRHPEV